MAVVVRVRPLDQGTIAKGRLTEEAMADSEENAAPTVVTDVTTTAAATDTDVIRKAELSSQNRIELITVVLFERFTN